MLNTLSDYCKNQNFHIFTWKNGILPLLQELPRTPQQSIIAASAGEDATQWAGPEGNWGWSSLYCTFLLFTYITSTQIEYMACYIYLLQAPV